ncbi:MAG: ABC transporter permease [Verrucomicrobiota bacterium]
MSRLRIQAGQSNQQYWRDLWLYRELFVFLAWRDFLVRYKQTVVGVAWSLLKPLLTMLVLTVVFGSLGKLPSGGIPYPLLVFSGLLPWQFFANALSESGSSLVNNSNLISKVYFPRLIIPISSILTSLVDFAISSLFLTLLFLYYQILPPPQIAFLPAFILLALTTSLGLGIWISALMVEFRDFRNIVPFIVQFGLYLSPVAFQSSLVPPQWRLLYSLNPIVGVIDGFRFCLLSASPPLFWPGLALSTFTSLALLFSGVAYFRKTERSFADLI